MFNFNIGSIILDVIKMFLMFFFSIAKPFLIILLILIFDILIHYFYYTRIKKIKKKVPYYQKYQEPSLFKKIFLQFPKRLVTDYLEKDPYDFNDYGIIFFVGDQGSGKTIGLVYYFYRLKQIYKELIIQSNFDIKFQDTELTHWNQLIGNDNGTKGVANGIDEFPSWFSNMDTKDLPPEILGEICQQRKQRKLLAGTVQVFGKLPKAVREQTKDVYVSKTILGCFTIMFRADPKSYNMDTNKFKKKRYAFCFVHTKELRESYDTYKRITKYKDTKFSRSLISGTLTSESREGTE